MSYDKLCRSKIYYSISAKYRAQDKILDQLKPKVNHIYEKDEKVKINFQPFNDECVLSKAHLDTNLSELK